MSDYSYNLWKLHKLTSSDPRMYLDIIVTNGLLATNPPNFRQSV
jgi:hypothetical protein